MGKYKGSEREKIDLENYYIEKEGKISNVLKAIPGSENSDINWFSEFFEKISKKNDLLKYKDNYNKSRKIKKIKKSKFSDIKNLIQISRKSNIDRIFEKYS